MRRLLVIALTLCGHALLADSPALTITQQLVPSPAPIGATDPAFSPASSGLRLTWCEPDAHNSPGLFASTWETSSARWSASRPYERSPDPADPLDNPSAPHVRFPDGSALSVFLPEKDGRILDLHTQHHRTRVVSPPIALSAESWPKDAASLTQPALAAREARVAAVWLNHAEKSPRLFAALSTNAGEQFFLPVRIDDSRPLGRASLVLLRDGSTYITWLEAHGPENAAALWLRRLSLNGNLSIPVRLTTADSAESLGHPQLGLLKDYDTTPAQLLIAHTLSTGGITQLVTRLITLPPSESFLQGRPCLTCPPDETSKPGHSLRGRVVKLIPRKHQVIVDHGEIPGILPAEKTTFHTDDKTLRSLSDATLFLARIEHREGVWWLFDVNVLTPHNLP